MGSRFYLSYTGSAPSGADCTTLAGDIETAWAAHLASLIGANIALNEVDVLDIATDSGLSGQWSGTSDGTYASPYLPAQVATNVEYGIARRYRGGKPRMYLPPAGTAAAENDYSYTSTFITAVNTGVAAFFAAIEALSVGSMGTLQHVNLSYYDGYTNVEIPNRRARSIPTYRATALHDNITGYSCKALMSSQKRRRTATTP